MNKLGFPRAKRDAHVQFHILVEITYQGLKLPKGRKLAQQPSRPQETPIHYNGQSMAENQGLNIY